MGGNLHVINTANWLFVMLFMDKEVHSRSRDMVNLVKSGGVWVVWCGVVCVPPQEQPWCWWSPSWSTRTLSLLRSEELRWHSRTLCLRPPGRSLDLAAPAKQSDTGTYLATHTQETWSESNVFMFRSYYYYYQHILSSWNLWCVCVYLSCWLRPPWAESLWKWRNLDRLLNSGRFRLCWPEGDLGSQACKNTNIRAFFKFLNEPVKKFQYVCVCICINTPHGYKVGIII